MTTATAEKERSSIPEFKPGVRADCCFAQATVYAVRGEASLLLCAHHGGTPKPGRRGKHYDKLIEEGWLVHESELTN